MTGRTLYDLWCDAWAARNRYANQYTNFNKPDSVWFPYNDPPAWPFLSEKERQSWNDVATAIRNET